MDVLYEKVSQIVSVYCRFDFGGFVSQHRICGTSACIATAVWA
jgi:hypothetical protein